jgi:paraquat-inducible protein B
VNHHNHHDHRDQPNGHDLPNGTPRQEPQPDPSHPEGDAHVPSSVEKKRRFSFIWLVPIVAVGLVIYLGYSSLAKRGPEITIHWKTADGLVANQTLVKYKAVAIGTVTDVDLGGGHDDVIVRVRMQRGGKFALTDHARFWVVRPRLTLANLSGLETLVSGAYIQVDPGTPGGKSEKNFKGLEDPPGVTSDEPGKTFDLKASRIGSLAEGAPVFFRDVTVGSMLKYDLGDGLGPVSIRVFIRAPYDRLVHPDTLFWNASGVSLKMGSEGIHLELESIAALLTGGIAFETPANGENKAMGENPPPFHLYDSKAKADASLFRENTPCVTYFKSSVQGLERGSPVQIFGVQIGAVKDVKLVFASKEQRFQARVTFDLQPERALKPDNYGDLSTDAMRNLVADGLHVVLDTSNMITGQKVLSLQYLPTAKGVVAGTEGDALIVPSQAGGIDGITSAVADIAQKLDKIPFDEIGNNLNTTMRTIKDTVGGPDLQNAIAKLSSTMNDLNQLAH